MGVADNKSYKDQYHFRDNYYGINEKDFSSINVDPKINTGIKENPYRSNVEIEKGELVLEPDLSAVYKAHGKKHTGGGTNVNLKPDSFIFSDDKSLSFSERERKLFEFKEGSNKKHLNTPAQVLKRNIDVEHYNRLVSNLDDPNKDDLAKKSSARMLEKYIQTLGNVAYLQEQKKGLPDGIPPFAMGTAPVYDSELKDDIMSQKQFAKYGGTVYGKGGPTPWGTWKGDKLPIFKKRYGVTNAADKIANLDELAKELNYTGPKDNKQFQEWLYNSSRDNRRIIDYWHNKYDDPNISKPESQRNRFDGKIGIRWQNALQQIMDGKPDPVQPEGPYMPKLPTSPLQIPSGPLEQPPLETIAPGEVNGPAQGQIEADWKFTPWQRLSHLNQAAKWAGAKRYMPMRSHLNPSYVDPQLVNPEQTIADLQGQANSQTRALGSLNPILRNAQASNVYGQLLDRIPGVRSQYDNQNAGITNQFRQYNNQIRNNATATNMQNDQQYYRESVEGRKNFDNLRGYLSDQWMNNINQDVQTNQTLAYNLLTQNNPAYSYNWDTGNFNRNPKSILDVQGSGSVKGDYLNEYLGKITGDWDKLDNKDRINLLKIMTAKGFTPAQQKKGGRFNPYK